MKILEKIIENKKKEIEKSKKTLPLSKIKKKLEDTPTHKSKSFYKALKGKHNIIAELKFSSPSSGDIIKPTKAKIRNIIQQYDCYASGVSVLTDKKFFKGDLSFINQVKKHTQLPILRKDFIIDPYQVYESRYYGADAILLIASLLSQSNLKKLLSLASKLGLDCLVETRNKEDIKKALSSQAKIIGINNRNLSSNKFEISLNTTIRLKKLIPKSLEDKIIIVSESGIFVKKDILKLDTNAVLIGTSLMKSKNIMQKLSKLHKTKIKICGITNKTDAIAAVRLGADLLGFNFYKPSPRYISPQKVKSIISSLPNTIQTVGIFVKHTKKQILSISNTTGIDFIQLHGDESISFTRSIQATAQVIKATQVKNTLPKKPDTYAQLYDTYDKKLYGGTGKIFNIKRTIKSQTNIQGKVFIAGGLNQTNILDPFKTLHPFALDICSGSESYAGNKSYSKIKDIISKVNIHENKN